MPRTVCCLALVAALAAAPAALAQREYGFDNRKPSGQPYLTPDETVRRMKVADGFEVKLFAAEPMLVNPIAFTIDERGRVWAVECFEYPKRTPKGQKPRDRIVILEDTDGDGTADKRTVFAEGKDFPMSFDMASGIEVGHGGVFLGAPPYLWFIENKDDKPGKFEVRLKGFGSQDTHETLNTFQWGPDGWLWGLHGIYTQSDVGDPSATDSPYTKMNAAVWRYHPVSRKFEVMAEGTSNPWGWDYRNTDGQMILACCVIPHLYHIVPGGVYRRQSGQSLNPYAYGHLNEICDHTFHKESGWAHAGLVALDTPLMPPELRDSVIFGSIHGCSIKRNVLKRNGSTFTASRADDFLVSGDKNFRPLNMRWGPNGDIYLSDWHDQNPCHQAQPDSWDYERGRIYRIQKKGAVTKKAEDLGAKSLVELFQILKQDNPYHYRTAQRLLAERLPKLPLEQRQAAAKSIQGQNHHAAWSAVAFGLVDQAGPGELGKIVNQILSSAYVMTDAQAVSRALAIRIMEQSRSLIGDAFEHLAQWAKVEPSSQVRLQLVSSACRTSSGVNTVPLLHALMLRKEDAADAVIPLMLWLAYEPRLVAKPQAELDWLTTNAPGNALVTDHILPRALRRLGVTGEATHLDAVVAFVAAARDAAVRRRALEGLAEALKGRLMDAPAGWAALQPTLLADADPQVQRLARALAVSFRDPVAAKRAYEIAQDLRKSSEERAEAVRQLAQLRPDRTLALFLSLAKQEKDLAVRLEAVRGLAAFDTPGVAKDLLDGWTTYPPAVRGEAVNVLAGRREGARALLDAVAAGRVAKTELSTNTVLRMRAFRDRTLNTDIEKVWGRVRDSSAEITTLIDKMRGELEAVPGSFARGRAVFDAQCAKCHRFENRGYTVGPELDGAGRDVEYILANVLDPNRVIGQPYFIRRLALKNGRIEEGLLAAEDQQTITLKGENDALKVVPRSEIAEVEVIEKSMMPEGLGTTMTVQDFRDLVRYLMAHPFVTEWQAAGPFPEPKSLPLPASERRSAGASGRVALPPADKESYYYLTTTVTAAAPVKTRLLLGAAHPVLVLIDGRQVYDGQPKDGELRTAVAVELTAGAHQVVIGVKYRGPREALDVRFLDPDRKLSYPEPAMKK